MVVESFERGDIGSCDVVDVHEVACLRTVLEHPGCFPPLEGGAEDRRDPGVRSGRRHAWSVHIVIAQRDAAPRLQRAPRVGEVLLRDLRCRVARTRVDRCRLVDPPPRDGPAALGTPRVEAPGGEVGLASYGGRHASVAWTVITSVAVC